jgi:HSP20 family protein
MFPLTKWSPTKELTSLHRDIDDLFSRFFGRTERLPMASFGWGLEYPAVNIKKEGDNFIVHAEIPGVDPKDIDINITGNMLTLRGQRKMEKKEEEKDYYVREISMGSFERTIALPVDINADNVKAAYKNGLLEITLPAAQAAKGKKIEVKVEEGEKQVKAA